MIHQGANLGGGGVEGELISENDVLYLLRVGSLLLYGCCVKDLKLILCHL
jgi:hypothetical protein